MLDILRQLAAKNRDRAARFPDYDRLLKGDILYFSNAINGEAGELANAVKKWEQGREFDRDGVTPITDAIRDEVADILIYLDLFCQANGSDLSECLADKFNRTSIENGYPERIYIM